MSVHIPCASVFGVTSKAIYRAFGIAHNHGCLICRDGIGKVHNRSVYILSIYILSSLWYNVLIILIGDTI